jgi:hypothetical protein
VKRFVGLTALLLVSAPSAQAQWSAAPAVAIGIGIPGTKQDQLAEGVVAKAGVWMRAPRVPVGFTVEGMFTHLRDGRQTVGSNGMSIGGATFNLTTRRHENRLDTYGVAGAGWYWFDNPMGRYTRTNAPGFNVGVGELLEISGHDLFIEVRFHALRTPMTTGSSWTTTLPIMLGMRF